MPEESIVAPRNRVQGDRMGFPRIIFTSCSYILLGVLAICAIAYLHSDSDGDNRLYKELNRQLEPSRMQGLATIAKSQTILRESASDELHLKIKQAEQSAIALLNRTSEETEDFQSIVDKHKQATVRDHPTIYDVKLLI
jgi:hypothetical protein